MTTSIRFASKTLIQGGTGLTLRGKISPINLTVPPHLSFELAGVPAIVRQVWADFLKEKLGEKEKAEFEAAFLAGSALHDADTVGKYLQETLNGFTIEGLSEQATASTKITLTQWKAFLKDVFLPLVNRVKQEQGKQVLEKTALKIWFDAFQAGPGMESSYKNRLVNLVAVMGESNNPETLEILLSDSFQAMIDWATAAPEKQAIPEFNCDI